MTWLWMHKLESKEHKYSEKPQEGNFSRIYSSHSNVGESQTKREKKLKRMIINMFKKSKTTKSSLWTSRKHKPLNEMRKSIQATKEEFIKEEKHLNKQK